MKSRDRRRRILAAFGIWALALFFLWDTAVLYPLRLFVVLLHEASHAVAAVATGGRVDSILITPDEGGLCYCPGGDAFLTLSAGYLGSLGWGALIFWAGFRKGAWGRGLAAVIGLGVLALSVLYLRHPFGLAFGLAMGAGLLAAARWLSAAANGWALAALGLTSVFYAILDIKSDVLDRPHLPSDAAMLAELTGVPTVVWGLLWTAAALGVAWALLRAAWRRA